MKNETERKRNAASRQKRDSKGHFIPKATGTTKILDKKAIIGSSAPLSSQHIKELAKPTLKPKLLSQQERKELSEKLKPNSLKLPERLTEIGDTLDRISSKMEMQINLREGLERKLAEQEKAIKSTSDYVTSLESRMNAMSSITVGGHPTSLLSKHALLSDKMLKLDNDLLKVADQQERISDNLNNAISDMLAHKGHISAEYKPKLERLEKAQEKVGKTLTYIFDNEWKMPMALGLFTSGALSLIVGIAGGSWLLIGAGAVFAAAGFGSILAAEMDKEEFIRKVGDI